MNSRIERQFAKPVQSNIEHIQNLLEGDSTTCVCGAILLLANGYYTFPGTKEGPNEIVCRNCYSKKSKAKQKLDREHKRKLKDGTDITE